MTLSSTGLFLIVLDLNGYDTVAGFGLGVGLSVGLFCLSVVALGGGWGRVARGALNIKEE